MRFLWVDAGNDANWAKVDEHTLTGVFYAGSDPPADVARRLMDTRARNRAGGVYSAWNWYEGEGIGREEGAAYAEKTHEVVSAIEAKLGFKSASFPKVQLNNEDHRPQVILDMLRRWRQLRPKHDTSWTMEGGQGGWMDSAFVAEVLSHRVRLVPQGYRGRMANIALRDSDPAAFYRELLQFTADPLADVDDLVERGFPRAIVSPMYEAAFLPLGWDGFCFTQGRLP